MTIDTKRLLEAAAIPEAEWMGLRRRRSHARFLVARDGIFEAGAEGYDDGVMVEALYNGHFGYAATNDLSPESMKRTGERALAAARACAPYAVHAFTAAQRPATVLRYETKRLKRARIGEDVLTAHLIAMCGALKVSDKIIQARAFAEITDLEDEIVSTSGAMISQSFGMMGTSFQAIAKDGAVIQRRTGNGPRGRTRQEGWEHFDFASQLADARKAGEQAIELLSAPDCPTMTCDLVLAPDQMMLQIHESVGHPLELDRILGDERNYAGSTFVKLSDIGSFRYGSPLMNISYDPTVSNELASYGADDIGNRAVKEFIVKDGLLVRALGSLESQARANVPGVANQRASNWNRPPIDRMANLNLEPGKDSFEAIIASIEKGIYMEANRSWSIDDYRNKFQFGCEYARLIEGGKLGKLVKNPNYRGISSTFWRNLFKVGDPSTFQVFGTPNCGKGEPNQVQTVGHASPVCAFKNVEVFGGEA